jgi:hypothetical protein
MHINTKKKLLVLNEFISKNYKKWIEKNPSITGVHIGLKYKNKIPVLHRYCIAFLVEKKEIKPKNEIPKHYKVKINGVKKIIPTDVVEVGVFQLNNIQLGDGIRNLFSNELGTFGLLLIDSNGIYALSNMHVLAPGYYNQNKNHFKINPEDQNQVDVELFNNDLKSYAFLQEGYFNGIDAAIARIKNISDFQNVFGQYGTPNGIREITYSNYYQLNVSMRGLASGYKNGYVERIGINMPTKIPGAYLNNLIAANLGSKGGDSGSPVFDNSNNVIGIVVGASNGLTYIIPIIPILNSFQMNLY